MRVKYALIALALTALPVARPGSAHAAAVAAAARERPMAALAHAPSIGLWSFYYRVLAHARFVDLTHTFGRDTPHWHGFGPMTEQALFTIPKDGFHVDRYCHVGQWGTHVDAPAHFHTGLTSVDRIPPSDMLLPLVVLDVHRQAARNPDYRISLAEVHAWERRYGPIPPHSFVAMRTDWSKRWTSEAAMQNRGPHGVGHYPAWSLPVLKYLAAHHIAAIGHETTDTDGGIAASHNDYSLESYWLGTDHYQIEMLAHLDQVPDAGALVMVTFPRPHNGAGFPARVVAIVPAGMH
jgi:kynurenine formamidase